MPWNSDAVRQVRYNYHRRGWPVLVGHLLGFASWPVLGLVFLALGRSLQRYVDERDGAKVLPVCCEVCGFVDEFRVVRGLWLQDPPHWYGFLNDDGITVCSTECAKHWEQHHMSWR